MLYLYKQETPNTDKFYYFTSTSQYKTALSTNLVSSVTLDSYRINANTIKVKLSTTITEAVADTLTYAIDERVDANNVVTYFRCYHVNSIMIQSGYVVLNCSIDLWASYFYKASISNINVNKCNRNVGIGVYDTIRGTKSETASFFDGNTIVPEKVSIVFTLNYNVKQNVLNSNSSTQLFAIDVKTLKALASDYPNVSALDIAISFVSGITGVAATGWGFTTYNDAQVLSAWLIDNTYLLTNSSNYVSVHSVNEYMDANGVDQNVYAVVPSILDKTKTISIDPNYNYYVGTRQNGLKIQRTTATSVDVKYRYIYGQSDLKVLVIQGDNMQDITEAFSVDLTINQGNVTGIKAVAKTMGIFMNTFAGMYGVATGKPTAAVLGISNLAKSTFNEVADVSGGKYVNGGDGYLTFYQIISIGLTATLHNPYCIVTYESNIDEAMNARHNGAYYNEVVASIASIFTKSLIGVDNNFTDTYIMASLHVDNIPNEAADFIKLKFASGIYLINLTT